MNANATDKVEKPSETDVPKKNVSGNGASSRPRDKKGHFLSAKGASEKKPSSSDGETVKIRIVKDKEPKQPKDFKGRLDDIKERLATRFIKSVIANKPRHIVIDGITYHSDTVLDEILAGWDKTEELVKEQGKCLAKGDKIISNGLSLMNLLDKRLSRVTTSRNRWRMFGLGMSIGFIGCVIVRSIYSFIH